MKVVIFHYFEFNTKSHNFTPYSKTKRSDHRKSYFQEFSLEITHTSEIFGRHKLKQSVYTV